MVFLRGLHGTPPLCTNGRSEYLMQLSVIIVLSFLLSLLLLLLPTAVEVPLSNSAMSRTYKVTSMSIAKHDILLLMIYVTCAECCFSCHS